MATEKGLNLICQIEEDVPRWMHGDPTRVRQVLTNHVSNAVKFTEIGSVSIKVEVAISNDIVVTLHDTGIGLTADQRAGLYQPFSQADESTTRRFGGTGLGLSISKRLIDLMEGRIEVSSTLGVGTEFRIFLPLRCAPDPICSAKIEPPPEITPPELEIRPVRILVAEDNKINQAVVQAVLSAIDATVYVVDDGEATLKMLYDKTFDLVLMDIHMPKMDGIVALQHIRAGRAGPTDVPVIALTADAMPHDADRFLSMGFDAVHAKPIRPSKLIADIAEVLEKAAHKPTHARTIKIRGDHYPT